METKEYTKKLLNGKEYIEMKETIVNTRVIDRGEIEAIIQALNDQLAYWEGVLNGAVDNGLNPK